MPLLWCAIPDSSLCSDPGLPSRSPFTPIIMITPTPLRARSFPARAMGPHPGSTLMDELFWRAVAGAAILGAVAGPIGCFVLWRRMAYLGASIAEMALLGAALGLLLGVDPLIGV